MMTAEMLFGRKVGGRLGVSEAAFANFVAAEVTPRFPEGLTVIGARGQWREASGAIVREPSRVVLLTFRDADDRAQRLRNVLSLQPESYQRVDWPGTISAVVVVSAIGLLA
jgi:hypothetical protein